MKMPLGIPVLKVTKFERDITMILRTEGGIRMQIPIPGKNAFGVEIANSTRTIVGLKDILQSYNFEKSKSPLTFALLNMYPYLLTTLPETVPCIEM